MQILELEQKYSELKSDLCGQLSKRTKLVKISEYLGYVLNNSSSQIIEPYIIDLIPDFLKYSTELEIRGLNPTQIKLVQSQLITLKNLKLNGIELLEFDAAIQSLESSIQLMNNWLESIPKVKKQAKIYFSLLEKNDVDLSFGYLESISIIVKNGEQRFHISPADLENDEQLENQIQLCFSKALEYCSHHIRKIKKSHTVYLHFENRLGIITGNSLGAALTVLFIEAILKFYNSHVIVNVTKNLAITGGIDKDSKIVSTSKAIIEAKVETVFYSDVEIMCVPKIDELWAEEKLIQLKSKYPKRDLKVIGLTDLNDLLDRRQIVDVRKQKLIVRSGKFVKKNWISAVATVLLAILFAYLFVMDFDDNPAVFSLDGKYVHIKNKNGKELWKKYFFASKMEIEDIRLFKNHIKILDVDGDGFNDVIMSNIYDKNLYGKPEIICYDQFGQKKWSYIFRDTVLSKREIIQSEFGTLIIDTLKTEETIKLFCIANNILSYPSAIFSLDAKTGERLPGTFWASGATGEGMLLDIDNDKMKELIGFGWDNGFEDVVIYAKEIDTLTSVRKSIDSYTLKNFPLGEMINYARVPKNDYENYFNRHRNSGIDFGSFCYSEYKKIFSFTIQLDDDNPFIGYSLFFNQNLYIKEILIGNDFRIARDTLVTHQKLKPPYTDTEEYKEIIKDNILYWKDGRWVNRNGIVKE